MSAIDSMTVRHEAHLQRDGLQAGAAHSGYGLFYPPQTPEYQSAASGCIRCLHEEIACLRAELKEKS